MIKWIKKLFTKESPKLVIKAMTPKEKTVKRFTALKDFYSEDFKSQYHRGFRYSLREGNTKLASAIPKWEKRKLIRIDKDI